MSGFMIKTNSNTPTRISNTIEIPKFSVLSSESINSLTITSQEINQKQGKLSINYDLDTTNISDGMFGQGFIFDGTGDYMTVSDSSSLDISK